MELIDQLNDPQTKAYAKHCLEEKSSEDLRAATNEIPDPGVLSTWGLTEGQYSEAVAAALAELD